MNNSKLLTLVKISDVLPNAETTIFLIPLNHENIKKVENF
jgi:hypothetical protein